MLYRVRTFAVLDELANHDVVARLRAARGDADLSATARANAVALADRLDHGVRIVLLGPQGAGKSTLCDALLGTWGHAAGQGQTRHFHPSTTSAEQLGLSENTLTLPVDACGLGRAQIIDFGSSDEPNAIRAALAFADIVLWCTQDFDGQEAGIWSGASDHLKDHSFMVLTKADVLAERGILQERIHDLAKIVSEEFHSLFPVAAGQVLDSLKRGAPVAPEHLAASGLKALQNAVSCSVTQGQRADMDSAMLFVERHGLVGKSPADPPAPPSDPRQPVPTPFRDAYDAIMRRAFDLAELSFDESHGDISEVLALCGTISEELVDITRGTGSDKARWAEWSDQFEEASDKIMLMTMENDTRSAADAVTILLQLRRDMEYMIAH
jgi:energy-coupling factor transporter ATP-binding protein EcfA2